MVLNILAKRAPARPGAMPGIKQLPEHFQGDQVAKIIQIEKERFDEIFQETLDKLALDRFKDGRSISSGREDAVFENSPIGEMHRKFHYEVCKLKRKLEDS
jgi:hypothetical protein